MSYLVNNYDLVIAMILGLIIAINSLTIRHRAMKMIRAGKVPYEGWGRWMFNGAPDLMAPGSQLRHRFWESPWPVTMKGWVKDLVCFWLGVVILLLALVTTPLRWAYALIRRWRSYRLRRRILASVPSVAEVVPPTIFYNTWAGVTVVCTEAAFRCAMEWHRDAVQKGYRVRTDLVVVKPCFIYYDDSVPVGEKGRTLGSSSVALFREQIFSRCHGTRMIDMYIPFVGRSTMQRKRDIELFRASQMNHENARAAIFGSDIPHAAVRRPA